MIIYRRITLIIIPAALGIMMAFSIPIIAWAQATFTPTATTPAITTWVDDSLGELTINHPIGAWTYYDHYYWTVPDDNELIAVAWEGTKTCDTLNWAYSRSGSSTYDLWGDGSGASQLLNCIKLPGESDSVCTDNFPGAQIHWLAYAPVGGDTIRAGFAAYGSDQVECSITINWFKAVYRGHEPQPTPDPLCPGVIYDGGMEQYPESDYWFKGQYESSDATFYRLNNQNLIHRMLEGPPYCGEGWHYTGRYESGIFQTNMEAADIDQDFCWPGGILYWQGAARLNKEYCESNLDCVAMISFLRPDDLPLRIYSVLDDSEDWTVLHGETISLPHGTYGIKLGFALGEGSDDLDGWGKDGVYWDNMEISSSPIDDLGQCIVPEVISGTVTPQVTYTSCAPYAISLDNCGFTQPIDDLTGFWFSDDNGLSRIYDHPVYGRIAMIVTGDWVTSQAFDYQSCGSGGLYVRFMALGNYKLVVRNVGTWQEYETYGSQFTTMELKEHRFNNLPNGNYIVYFENIAVSGAPLYIDDVGLGSGGIGMCEDVPQSTNTPGATPTRTTTPSPTITRTGTQPPTSTSLPTRTATQTIAPPPSLTPWPSPTASPVTPTRTPMPSSTPRATSTSTPPYPPTSTTDAGTDTPTPWPTYTDVPPSPTDQDPPTPTYQPPLPPYQPPPDCYAACVKPAAPHWDIDFGETLSDKIIMTMKLTSIWFLAKQIAGHSIANVSGWVEYARCYALSWFVWCPEHTTAIIALPTQFASHEPFGTIGELNEGIKAVSTALNVYNWDDTGVKIAGTPMAIEGSPNWDEWMVPGNSPYNGGLIDITGQSITYIEGESSTDCEFELKPYVGDALGAGMCFAFTTLNRLGVLGWFQFIVNLCSIIIFVTYIFKRWINAGAHG